MVISIRMTDEEKQLADAYARLNGCSLSEAIKRAYFERIEEEYGKSDYGSVKYTENELYWIGYIYRYYSYTYARSSVQVYKTIKPKELRSLFLPYHTMDPAQAIDRIIEAKGLPSDNIDEEQRQFQIFKRIRNAAHRT